MRGKARRREIEFVKWTGDNYDEVKDLGGSGVMDIGGRLCVYGQGETLNLYKGWYLIKEDGDFDVADEQEFSEKYEVIE